MVKLADAAIIFSGTNPAPTQGEGCRFVQIRNLSLSGGDLLVGRRPTAGRAVQIETGDILLAARGERAPVIIAGEAHIGAYVALDVYLIRPDRMRLDPEYLAAFLMRPAIGALLRRSTAGSSLPRIPKDAISDLEVPLPGIDRQRAIGGVASCVQRRRELANRLIAAESMLVETFLERVLTRLN